MRAVWRTLAGPRDLRLVLSAGIISMTGDWILIWLRPEPGPVSRATEAPGHDERALVAADEGLRPVP